MSAVSNVLVIDDDVAVRLRIGDLMRQVGNVRLHEASDGSSGLAAARALHPDLILLDIMMPGLTGFEVCSALRAEARTRDVPVIVLSAADESEALIRALEAGADDFLRKPLDAPELRAKVRTVTRLNRYRTLAAERDRFRWLLDRSTEPLILADARGALVDANESARTIFDLGDGRGTDVVAAVSRHFRADPADAWAAGLEPRRPANTRFTVMRPESPQAAARWFEVEFHAFDAGAPQTLLKFTDVTARVRHNVETYTFQHLISHKLRTPLNGLAPIFTFLEASEELGLAGETADLLRIARESAERLEDTLSGILAYHSATFAPRPRTPGAARPLRELLASAASTADLRDRLRIDGPDGSFVHAEALEIVLTEALENYAKFGEARRSGVEVTLRAEPDHWSLCLFAPGENLPPDILARLGQPYAQLESRPTGEIPGIGLGLATARLLLRAIGGDLRLTNHPERAGVVTTLCLPLAAFQPSTRHAIECAAG